MQEDLSTQLKRALDEYPETVRPKGSTLPAAVLILLYRQGNLWHILFTRRTQTVASHQGQVSFPGGQIEAQEKGPIEAALREAREEIGIRPMDVTLLGSLKPMLSGTNFIITPIVGNHALALSTPSQPGGGCPNLRRSAEVACRSGQPGCQIFPPIKGTAPGVLCL